MQLSHSRDSVAVVVATLCSQEHLLRVFDSLCGWKTTFGIQQLNTTICSLSFFCEMVSMVKIQWIRSYTLQCGYDIFVSRINLKISSLNLNSGDRRHQFVAHFLLVFETNSISTHLWWVFSFYCFHSRSILAHQDQRTTSFDKSIILDDFVTTQAVG